MAVVSLMDLWDQFQKWKNRRDNPHEVTAAQVGTYTKEEINKITTGFIPNGFLPFSRFGPNNRASFDYSVRTTGDQVMVEFQSSYDVVMGGTVYFFSPAEWTFTTVRGKMLYVYIMPDPSNQDYNAVMMEATDTPRADTPSNFLIGTLDWTGGADAPFAQFAPVLMLETYRLSSEPIGSAIPVSTGRPTDPGDFKWR